jgi:hypothetical protein
MDHRLVTEEREADPWSGARLQLGAAPLAGCDFKGLAEDLQARFECVRTCAFKLFVAGMHPVLEADTHAGQSQPKAPPVNSA